MGKKSELKWMLLRLDCDNRKKTDKVRTCLIKDAYVNGGRTSAFL